MRCNAIGGLDEVEVGDGEEGVVRRSKAWLSLDDTLKESGMLDPRAYVSLTHHRDR